MSAQGTTAILLRIAWAGTKDNKMAQTDEGEPNSARAAEARNLVFDAVQASEDGNKEEALFLAGAARDLDEVTAAAALERAGLKKK